VLAAEELGGSCDDPLALAIEIDGVADNAAAAFEGGVTINVGGKVSRLEPPDCVELLIAAPSDAVETPTARRALPAQVELGDAVANAGFAAVLGAGIAANDAQLIAHGLDDRLHQRARSPLFPKSFELLDQAAHCGALGATISGAGPSVLIWCEAGSRAKVAAGLAPLLDGWAELLEVEFSTLGAVIEVD
jgi:homoserine kinase